jgi:hypothetical protein
LTLLPLRAAVVATRRCNSGYRLAFVVDEACIIRFDNETGKGDHKHIAEEQVPYTFTSLVRLIEDFWTAIEAWERDEHG